MKKLMIAAASVAMVGAAFATQVADYRATVKFVDMQQWKTGVTIGSVKAAPMVKVVKVTTLRGYVVYNDCNCVAGNSGKYNPAFLVVKSFNQYPEGGKLLPKVFPADLLVRTIDNSLGLAQEGDKVGAEGYLFAGAGKGSTEANYGLFVNGFTGVAPWMTDLSYSFGKSRSYGTRLLFGAFNDATYDANGNPMMFYESWLDHAGFGSTAWYPAGSAHCGRAGVVAGVCLEKLQGYLIGGLFLCYKNGDPFMDTDKCDICTTYDFFNCHHWLGTTDVVAGYWGMKKNAAVSDADKKGLTLAQDERFFLSVADQDPESDDDEDVLIEDEDLRAAMTDILPMLKTVCIKMEPSIKGLSFLDSLKAWDDDETVKFLTRGLEYPGAEEAE